METVAAIYVKVSSPAVAEAEVAELLQRLANDGCTLAQEDAFIDASDGFDELERLVKWVGKRTFNVVYCHREITLEERDAYLGFIKNLYTQNISIVLCD